MEQNTERIWNLVARKFSGDATAEELAELELLLLQSPQENYSMEILHDLWNSKPELNRQYSENKYKALVLRMQQAGIDEGRFKNKDGLIFDDNYIKAKSSKKWFLWIASFIMIGLAVFFLLSDNEPTGNKKQPAIATKNEVNTKYGSKTTLVLPDGSKVWLNAGSKMTYDKDYGINIREVNLTGEAYFDVTRDPKKPFIIHTSKINIRVLGTAFNVRCYPDEKNTETSLVRGSLEVSLRDREEKFILKPNEKLTVSNEDLKPEMINIAGTKTPAQPKSIIELGHLSVMPQDNSIIETSWINNKLVFRSETFEEVAHKMEKWYAVNLIFKNEKLRSKRFTGVFENETIGQALDALELTTAFMYRINRDSIFIY
ncbi:MAG: FecR family protein [Ferruginibacter sp.]